MEKINRRKFVNTSGLFLGGVLAPLQPGMDDPVPGMLEIGSLPNFCAHEHWGSLDSVGFSPDQGGYRCDSTAGALPVGPTSIWDLLLDPYQKWWLMSGGMDPDAGAKSAGYGTFREWWDKSPRDALNLFRELSGPFMLTGGFQCTRKGILALYGTDIAGFELREWEILDSKIRQNYSGMFSWNKEAMKKAGFSILVRPVQPEFYVQEASPGSKEEELSFTHTMLRIDPFLDLWPARSPRRDALSAIAGVEPADAGSWRRFIGAFFDLAAKNKAAGIKQLQAYGRQLNFIPRTDSEVVFRGDLKEDEVLGFQDWVMHECCRQAHERKWVHQVHVGTNNIGESGPLPLESLAKKYSGMNIVMIHCWPFLEEAGYLAKHVPNLFLDTCWMPVLNPDYLHQALSMWMNYVPVHKIMLSHDSTHVEMATGSSLFTREILAEILVRQKQKLQVPESTLRQFAADMLHNNAVHLYHIGEEYRV